MEAASVRHSRVGRGTDVVGGGTLGLMKKFEEVLALYRRHGWQLARVLMCAESRGGLPQSVDDGVSDGADLFGDVPVTESIVDAMWFRRAAQEGRESWELRLVGDPPFALLEVFEPDEAEEDREDVRREMEARLRERAAPPA